MENAKKEYSERLSLQLLDHKSFRNPLCFVIGTNVVCEKFYAACIGMCDDDTGKRLKTWTDEVAKFTGK